MCLFLIANVNSALAGSQESTTLEENKITEDAKKALEAAKKAIEKEVVVEPLEDISDEDLDLLEEFFEQAQDLFDEENYEEAIIYYDKVLSIDSADFDALNGMALSLYNIGHPEEAITYFDKVLEINSSFIVALNGKAIALYDIGNHEEAITYFDKVLEIDSSDLEATYGKALALESLGRVEEAIANLEEIIALEPPGPEFRVPPEGTVNQAGVEEIAENDQTLFVIVGVFIVILISIIIIDYFARRRKSVLKVETAPETKQTILIKPSSSHYIKKENDFHPTPADTSTDLEVKQAIKVLQNLKDMNMLDNPKTAKQFLLNKGFSPNAVKKSMLDIGLDPSYVTDL